MSLIQLNLLDPKTFNVIIYLLLLYYNLFILIIFKPLTVTPLFENRLERALFKDKLL